MSSAAGSQRSRTAGRGTACAGDQLDEAATVTRRGHHISDPDGLGYFGCDRASNMGGAGTL